MENQTKEIKGWEDIHIDLNTPLGMVIDMINVLNQRLVTIENMVKTDEGITLTETYRKQAEEEYKRRLEEAKENKE